ncbi:MAG: hypothetical protein LBU23_00370 [Planctomycetota bacterium]|jgi:hypothetical protein|nr:hypothetical protein [Planctomycetota bacterium]
MQASEGKLGRVFMLRLDEGDNPFLAIEGFAAENGVLAAQVFSLSGQPMVGSVLPDPEGKPRLRFSAGQGEWPTGETILQEMLGISLRRMVDPVSGLETLAKLSAPRTRVMEKPAPEPEHGGPGTVPVYLFNAEFN